VVLHSSVKDRVGVGVPALDLLWHDNL
jgi:hypothetical protein